MKGRNNVRYTRTMKENGDAPRKSPAYYEKAPVQYSTTYHEWKTRTRSSAIKGQTPAATQPVRRCVVSG
jgi:hypothetical protein